MASVQSLANTILRRGFEENVDISPMKLQKIMYFVCAKYVQDNGVLLTSEPFCVWQYGPVLASIYDEFKSFHSSPITEYAKDADGKSYAIGRRNAEDVYRVIDEIWSKYSHCTGVELSRITHKDGSGWSRAFERRAHVITREDMENDSTF